MSKLGNVRTRFVRESAVVQSRATINPFPSAIAPFQGFDIARPKQKTKPPYLYRPERRECPQQSPDVEPPPRQQPIQAADS